MAQPIISLLGLDQSLKGALVQVDDVAVRLPLLYQSRTQACMVYPLLQLIKVLLSRL